MSLKCAALRGPRKRVACAKPASPTPFLVANELGFFQTFLCLWCAIEQPRQWALGAHEPTGDPSGAAPSVGVFSVYPDGPWEPSAGRRNGVAAAVIDVPASVPDLGDLMAAEFA